MNNRIFIAGFKLTFINFIIVLLVLGLSGFSNARKRKFEVTFDLKNIQSFVPSGQMAIWLEKSDGTFVKTLFLSDYLSYGGFKVSGICNDWSSRSGWENVTMEEFDAVTGATPAAGNVKLRLECPGSLVPDGQYLIFIEVHLVEEYNELYSGRLDLSGKKTESVLKVKYIPENYPKKTEGDILTDVQVVAK